jgi:hypothetical protein
VEIYCESTSPIANVTREAAGYIGRLHMPGYLDATSWTVGVLSELWANGCPECSSENVEHSEPNGNGHAASWRCNECDHDESVD